MGSAERIQSDFSYLKQLATAGLDGAASALRQTEGRMPARHFKTSWKTPTVGAALGILAARLTSRRRPALLLGGAIGTAVGLGATVAWSSRGLVRAAAQEAAHRVNLARDARWLELNPIDYA